MVLIESREAVELPFMREACGVKAYTLLDDEALHSMVWTDALKLLRPDRIPKHVAIVMDGNRRWARQRLAPPITGHRAGAKALKDVVAGAKDIGIKELSVFAFSKENRYRSEEEVTGLYQLFSFFVKREIPRLKEKNVRTRFIGDLDELPEELRDIFQWGQKYTENCGDMTLNVLINYSGRWDIEQAVKRIIEDGIEPSKITEELITRYLSLSSSPDLVIRTSGELRISNFLIWQIAYSELYFSDKLWPDFNRYDLLEAVLDYQRRERRFGK